MFYLLCDFDFFNIFLESDNFSLLFWRSDKVFFTFPEFADPNFPLVLDRTSSTKKSEIGQLTMSDVKKMKWETSDLSKKVKAPPKKTMETLVRLLWRAAAPGLKPLRLLRAHT